MQRLLTPQEYQSQARSLFLDTQRQIELLLPGSKIEHVGSSSIEGAVSKGDVDICVVVASDQMTRAFDVLLGAGFSIKLDTLRTEHLCMFLSSRTDADVAIQLVASGSKYEYFMRFRDVLNSDPNLVASYNDLKNRYFEQGEDVYREQKSYFIAEVLHRFSA